MRLECLTMSHPAGEVEISRCSEIAIFANTSRRGSRKGDPLIIIAMLLAIAFVVAVVAVFHAGASTGTGDAKVRQVTIGIAVVLAVALAMIFLHESGESSSQD